MTPAQRQKDYYWLRRENGRCVRCPRPPVPGRVLCAVHREQQRVSDQAKYQRRKAAQA